MSRLVQLGTKLLVNNLYQPNTWYERTFERVLIQRMGFCHRFDELLNHNSITHTNIAWVYLNVIIARVN
jgi:hypothetical protein